MPSLVPTARFSIVLCALIVLPWLAAGQQAELPPDTLLPIAAEPEDFGATPSILLTGTTHTPFLPPLYRYPGWTPTYGTGGASLGPPPVSAAPVTEAVPEVAETPSFSLPGGYGRSPETIEAGKGFITHQRPVEYSFNLELGYDDNVLSSGKTGVPNSGNSSNSNSQGQGIVGSFVANGFIGQRIRFLTKRNYLSLDWNGGGSYFLDRPVKNFLPSGTFHLIGASKLSTRTLLSADIAGGYFSDANLSLINAPKQSGQGDYINTAGTVDLSYQLTRRYSLDTTLILGSQTFMQSSSQGSDYVEVGLGEALRYVVTRRFTAVLLDTRAVQTRYKDSNLDYDTEYFLCGFDAKLDRRFSASFRFGETLQQYRATNVNDAAAPFLETALTYGFGKASSLSWNNRYGYETLGSDAGGGGVQLTYRTGLNLSLVFSPKVTTSLGFDYTDSKASSDSSGQGSEQTVGGTLALEYTLSRWWSFYGKYIRSQVLTDDPVTTYSRNQYFLGAFYRF